jgi:NRPS condensation-like uncharacterized protein
MAKTARKPLVFEEDRRRTTTPKTDDQELRQQIGTRIPRADYRRLKAYAALQGLTVATLVAQAISEFLANQPIILTASDQIQDNE